MKAVVQRVNNASVTVDNIVVGKITKGLLVYLCIEKNDEEEKLNLFANKIVNLRIFRDENDKMNLSLKDINGEMLVISQFTLSADPFTSGNRPSFSNSEEKERSKIFYNKFIELVKSMGINTQSGSFGKHMDVKYTNDGPVTIIFSK